MEFLRINSVDRSNATYRLDADLFTWQKSIVSIIELHRAPISSRRCIGISNSRLHSHAANCTNAADGPPAWLQHPRSWIMHHCACHCTRYRAIAGFALFLPTSEFLIGNKLASSCKAYYAVTKTRNIQEFHLPMLWRKMQSYVNRSVNGKAKRGILSRFMSGSSC